MIETLVLEPVLAVAKDCISGIVNNIYDYVKTKANKTINQVKLIKNYDNYYSKSLENLNHFKTFLFDTKTVPFINVYYPLYIKKTK